MEVSGRTFAVNGFGFKQAAAGGGRPVAVVIDGMAPPKESALLARLGPHIAGGGRFLVRRNADVRLQTGNHLPHEHSRRRQLRQLNHRRPLRRLTRPLLKQRLHRYVLLSRAS